MRSDTPRSRSAWSQARSELMKIKLEAIISEADLLFAHKGYNSTSLDDIAGRLHITKTALYHYVKNKNELLCLCYQRAMDLTEQCYERADREGHTGLEKLLAYLRFDASSGVLSMTPLAELDAVREPKARRELGRRIAACEKRFRGFIELGIRDGSIGKCDPQLTALFILGASRHMMQWYNPDAGHNLEAIVERFIDFCCHGLEARVPAAAERKAKPA